MPESWRQELKKRCASLPESLQSASAGLLANFSDRRARSAGREAMEGATPAERVTLWAIMFPAIQAEIEIAWNELSMQVVARRDGGIEGSGDRFTWPPSPQEAAEHRFTWLRKLLIITGPNPTLTLPELLVKAAEYKGHSYDRESGHIFDDDAPAYLAVPILNRGGPLADESLDVLSRSLDGSHPHGRFGRHVMTALLCCDRPEAWALVDGHLANSGLDQGFRDSLTRYRQGIHPGAWRHFLRTVAEHRLWRYETVKNGLPSWLGIQWNWKAQPGPEGWVRMWAELNESESLRAEKLLSGGPAELFLALHALAKEDGPAAIHEVERITKKEDAERRIACAFFLSICPAEHRTACLAQLVGDTDARVATVATRTLASNPHRPSLPGDFSQRMEVLLKQEVEIAAMPAPFPEAKPDQEEIIELMVSCLKDGDEERMLPWLGVLTIRARQMLITKCNRMTQTAVQRTLLFKLMRDAHPEVAQHAIKAARAIALSSEELSEVEAMLALKQTERRLLLIDLLMRQLSPTVLACTQRLIEASKLEQRLAGYELMRRLVTKEELHSQVTILVTQAEARRSLSQDERNHLQEIKAVLGPAKEEAPPTSANAFGLIDPAKLPVYPPLQDRGVMLHSPNTVALLKEMDALLTRNRDVEFTILGYDGQPKTTTLAEGVPSAHLKSAAEDEVKKKFPLFHIWADWWQARPAESRDPDGFELERMAALLSVHESTPPKALMLLYGISALPKLANRTYHLSEITGWLRKRFAQDNWQTFLLDAAEQALFLVRHEKEMWPAHRWVSRAHDKIICRLAGAEEVTAENMKRYWQMTRRSLKHFSAPLYLWDVLKAFVPGVISEDEFIWWLLGDKDLARYHNTGHFSEFGQTMSSHYIRRTAELQNPRVMAVIDRCRQRIVEVELKRGEAVQDSSHAAKQVSNLCGMSWLLKILVALGSGDLRRGQRSDDFSRFAIFSHLICVCQPGDDDTAESFLAAWKQSSISKDRLIEVSVLAPQWSAFIGHAIGVPGLKDAVDWIHAHTKTSEWSWKTKTREMWAGELSRLTPVSAEDLQEGAVDAAWFQRAHAAVGSKVWNQLYDAAKFACSGSGHSRARMFADALLGEVTATELADMIKTKGHQDAVRSIGLVPMPTDAKKRKAELLKRYRILAAFRHGSAKSKAQKRASEETACRIGMSNLARAAGYADPERFAWAMETEEAHDLTSKAQQAEIGDVTVKLDVTPFGKIELVAAKAGKPLKSVPPALKKHAALAALIQRREEARDQVARMRPALEGMMVRGVSLDAGEWRDLMRHPFVAPLLDLLVLTSPEGPVGFPLRDGSGLLNAEGKTVAWPPDKTPLRLAHPGDLLPAKTWHAWQSACFDRRIVQPFKQVFRELYVVVDKEMGPHGESRRYEGHALQPHQALAILGKRGWVHHPEDGLHRVYHAADCVAWLSFEEYFHHPGELQQATVSAVRFTNKAGRVLPIENVEPRIFSEAMRDVDLIVSVAHVTGTDPEVSRSSVEMREALIRETCRLLKLDNVRLEPPSIHIQGTRGAYRVHLSSGVVHFQPGRMLYLHPVAERDRLFLPFADDDPKSVEILSKVLLFAEDKLI
ncbi:MAG: DUF5724 domain-containing protein, partial [Prosthecobacter sp.]|nr:DUF5724 domain-containing protein [Prosthecobacter sp.]